MLPELSAEAAIHALNGHLEPAWGLREPVSCVTHAVAALLAVAGTIWLWRRSAGDRAKQVSMAVFGASMVALYAASSTYHGLFESPAVLQGFRRLDHACVFVLIAGTFTPFYVNAARGWWRTSNLAMIWLVGLAGIAFKVTFIDTPDAVSSGLYVGMGWLALLGYFKFAEVLSHRAMALCGLGGIFYSLGAAVDATRWPVPSPGVFGFHEVLHVLVVAGTLTHFVVILHYIVPLERSAVDALLAPSTLVGEGVHAEATSASPRA